MADQKTDETKKDKGPEVGADVSLGDSKGTAKNTVAPEDLGAEAVHRGDMRGVGVAGGPADVAGRNLAAEPEKQSLAQRVDAKNAAVAHVGDLVVAARGVPPLPVQEPILPPAEGFDGAGDEEKEKWSVLHFRGRKFAPVHGEQPDQIGPESGRTYHFRFGAPTLVDPVDEQYFLDHEVFKFEKGSPDDV